MEYYANELPRNKYISRSVPTSNISIKLHRNVTNIKNELLEKKS